MDEKAHRPGIEVTRAGLLEKLIDRPAGVERVGPVRSRRDQRRESARHRDQIEPAQRRVALHPRISEAGARMMQQGGVDRRSVSQGAGEQERPEQRMVLEGHGLGRRQVLPLEAQPQRRMPHPDVVRKRTPHQTRQARRHPQRGAEQPRRDQRSPDRMLVPGRVVPPQRFQFVPDLLREAQVR